MPTGKAQYDHYGDLKSRNLGWRGKVILPSTSTAANELDAIREDEIRADAFRAEWKRLHEYVQRELRSLYPRNDMDEDATFGYPADAWASVLLEVAQSEVATWLWLGQRLTKEQLRAEQADILKALEKAHTSLTGMSYDLHNLLDHNIDVLEVRDVIGDLIPHINALREKIGALRRAKKYSEVEHAAALRMTVEVVRFLEENGSHVAATADKDRGYISNTVRILKVLGDALKLTLDETTWRDLIIEAKPMIAARQSPKAPAPRGA